MKFSRYLVSVRSWSFPTFVLLCVALAAFASGCGGDIASGNGELGMVNYSIFSSYYMTSDDLRQVKIVTGSPQGISLSLTDAGASVVTEDDVLGNRIAPSSGVTVEGDGYSAQVTVTSPGEYELETLRNDQLFDKIKLQFERPASLELLTWIRPPSAADFTAVDPDAGTSVPEGTQALFLAVPLGPDGQRLAGELPTVRTIDPDWAIVEGENVDAVYENAIYNSSSPSIYFIEPATVTVRFQDPVSGASGTHTFQITPLQKG